VTSTTTNATNDIGRKVALFWAVVLAVANATTILADLVFVIPQSAI